MEVLVALKNKVMKDSSRKQFSAAEFISNEVTPTTIGYIFVKGVEKSTDLFFNNIEENEK